MRHLKRIRIWNVRLWNDLDAMNEYMNRVALKAFSSFDTGTQPSQAEPEWFYHGFVLGLIVDLAGRYTVLSNRESDLRTYLYEKNGGNVEEKRQGISYMKNREESES